MKRAALAAVFVLSAPAGMAIHRAERPALMLTVADRPAHFFLRMKGDGTLYFDREPATGAELAAITAAFRTAGFR